MLLPCTCCIHCTTHVNGVRLIMLWKIWYLHITCVTHYIPVFLSEAFHLNPTPTIPMGFIQSCYCFNMYMYFCTSTPRTSHRVCCPTMQIAGRFADNTASEEIRRGLHQPGFLPCSVQISDVPEIDIKLEDLRFTIPRVGSGSARYGGRTASL